MRVVLVLLAIVVQFACGPVPPIGTPSLLHRPMAIHTCVAGAEVWLDGAGVPDLRKTADANGNVEFLIFPASIGAFNLHATSPKFPEYGAVITTKPSIEPLIIILGSCAK
jgi:hypothetical protein